ncbi:MAG TPA: zinc ribbon domain-containing protein [Chitinophagaceae bacterium]|jgi:dolichyl-phosphate-mannose--protein O-mannosyl transferase|nr:zinc ribbon domain-containing protein [Chitinophagaceae bacterium]
MTCNNCGKINDSESNFCKYCGDNLNPIATDPNHTIFDRTYQAQTGSNIDLGYLIIAILVLVNVFMWFFWSFMFGGAGLSEDKDLYKTIRVLSTILSIAQFAVMFIFAKRPAYRIIIGIIAGIFIIYDFYYLMLSLTDNKY